MTEESDYLMICSNSYGRDILGSIDRTMKRLGAERTVEGRMRIWKKDGKVLGNGFSIGSAELARIHRDMLAQVLSAIRAIPVHPLDDSKVVAQFSQDLYQELLEMHRQWVLGLKLLYLAALTAIVFVTCLRLLIFSEIFPQYEIVFEYWSYVIVEVLPLSLGLGTLWYMYLGGRASKLVQSMAEPGESTALIVRFSQEHAIDLPAHLSKDKENGSTADASEKPPIFILEEAVSEHISFSQYSLYLLTFSTHLQERAVEQLHERGGLVLSIGRPYTLRRALFNIRITYSLTLGMLFVAGLILSTTIWTWFLGYLSMQFMVLFTLSLLTFLVAIRLLRKRVWLWLERRFFKK